MRRFSCCCCRWWARVGAVLARLDGSTEPRDLALAGWVIGAGLGLSLGLLVGGGGVGGGPALRPLLGFGAVLALFHTLELAMTAAFHPQTLSFDSSLLNHSREYLMAHIAGVVEFVIETYVVKDVPWRTPSLGLLLALAGLGVCIAGQLLRTLAMWQAGRNFTHVIATVKDDKHVLVTGGVYALVRHPSYLGFFLWAVGAQILLANPICAVVFVGCLWKYFSQRIAFEEQFLVRFFGDQYVRYRARVPWSGIPFVCPQLY